MKTFKKYGRAILPPLIMLSMIVFACVFVVRNTEAEPVDTYHAGWSLVRAKANEDGASFAAVYDLTGVGTTNGDYASMGTGAFRIPARRTSTGLGYSQGTKWAFVMCGKNFNNVDDTFSFNVVGWSRSNGMLQVICEGDCVLGTQAVVKYPDTGNDALGELVDQSSVTYTHATTTFTVTNAGFTGAVAGMLARVTGSNLTNAIVQVTTVTDANTIVCSGVASTDNNTDSTVEINPSFWVDTINLDQVTKWSGAVADPNTANGYYQMDGRIAVVNSGDNEVAELIIDTAGLEYIQFVIYDADAATGEEAGEIAVYGRPY